MTCEACSSGDHPNCGLQAWCECPCDGSFDASDTPAELRDFPHDRDCKCQECIEMAEIEWEFGDRFGL